MRFKFTFVLQCVHTAEQKWLLYTSYMYLYCTSIFRCGSRIQQMGRTTESL